MLHTWKGRRKASVPLGGLGGGDAGRADPERGKVRKKKGERKDAFPSAGGK